MKKIFPLLLIITIVFISCKKDTSDPPKSQWTFDGKTYKGIATSYPLGSQFSAADSLNSIGMPAGNYIAIDFYYGYFPISNGTFKVVKTPTDITECSITVSRLGASSLTDYTSINSTSEVSVEYYAKLKATFSNVVLSNYNGTITKTVSGTLEEQ